MANTNTGTDAQPSNSPTRVECKFSDDEEESEEEMRNEEKQAEANKDTQPTDLNPEVSGIIENLNSI